jgi:hypothetical protein
MAKSFLTEYRLELASFLSLLFGFLTVVSSFRVYELYDPEGNQLPSYLSWIDHLASPFGDWITWIVVIGPIGLVVCAWWFYDFVKKTRKLAKLIDTPSKAKFVRNLDEIEYLAWSLPQRYEDQVIAKKREFKL